MTVVVNPIIAGGGGSGGGGVNTFSGLTDAGSANLPALNAPLGGALALLQPLLVGSGAGQNIKTVGGVDLVGTGNVPASGGGVGTPVTWSLTIPLDTTGPGKKWLGGDHLVVAAETYTFSGQVEEGNFAGSFVGDGVSSHVPTFTGFVVSGAYDFTLNQQTLFGIVYEFGTAKLYMSPGQLYSALTFGVPHIENANAAVIIQPMSGQIGSTIPAPGDITITNDSGRVAISVATDGGSNLLITVNSGHTWQSAPSIAIAASKVSNITGTLSGASGTLIVTNNLTIPVPGTPTSLVNGTAGPTSVPLSVTPATVDGTHGTPTLYTWQYRLHAGPGAWTAGGTSTGPSKTVIGLTASTAYDFQVQESNGTGAGPFSAPLLNVSTAAGASSYTDNFNRANSGTLGNASGGFTWVPRSGTTGIVSNKAQGIGSNDVDCGINGACTIVGKLKSDLAGFDYLEFWGDGAGFFVGLGATTGSGTAQLFYIDGTGYHFGAQSGSAPFAAGVESSVSVAVTIPSAGLCHIVFTVDTVDVLTTQVTVSPFGTFAGFTLGGSTNTMDDWGIS